MAEERVSKECVLCRSSALKQYFAIDSHLYYRCRDCRLVQMNAAGRKVSVGDDYAGYDLEKRRAFTRLFWMPRYERAIALIKKHKKNGRLLDVGCGTGEFLEIASEAGFVVSGIEPSVTASGLAREKNEVIRGEFEAVPLPAEAYDVATLWSVLEHVPDPSAFLRKIYLVLKRDGLLALRIPCSSGLLPSAARWVYRLSAGSVSYPLRVVYQLDWHYKHLFFYTRKNASLLLRRSGFEVLAEEPD
ncbi:MAG: class I SAM-dependent methyltransferase, partial [Acidobacteriota bacterium]